jgi:anthranilate/para-aminobenzoate synthase component I
MAPSRSHPLPASLTPPAVVAAWRRRGPVVALETGLPSAAHGEQSLVAGVPRALLEFERGRARVTPLRGAERWPTERELADAESPFHALETCVAALREPPTDRTAPFGAFGWFGYECVAPPALPRLAPYPDGWFLLGDVVVQWERRGAAPKLWCSDEALARELVAELTDASRDAAEPAAPLRPDDREPSVAPGDLARPAYADRFAQARAALAAGESYQLCFTYPLERPLPARAAFDLWLRLRRDNPAPFSAYVEEPRFALVSCSPERFVRVDRAGRVEARPMKGTASKPADPAARAAVARELCGSEKTLAENLMIADLLRNDLGRVCKLGSVRASQPALVEEHATLLQMVSVIEGTLAAGRTTADLLRSAFPPGSMTGAPKERSLELLRALERGPRGPYSGILGWQGVGGACDWSVVIRTALCAGGVARVNVGGGLVWDSRADDEWDESRAKAAPLLRALEALARSAP